MEEVIEATEVTVITEVGVAEAEEDTEDEEGIKAMHLEEVEGTVLVIRAG